MIPIVAISEASKTILAVLKIIGTGSNINYLIDPKILKFFDRFR